MLLLLLYLHEIPKTPLQWELWLPVVEDESSIVVYLLNEHNSTLLSYCSGPDTWESCIGFLYSFDFPMHGKY